MDNAILAVWYDLPNFDNTDYIDWLHGDYLPDLRTRPGFLWTAHYRTGGDEGPAMNTVRGALGRSDDPSIGTGTQYLMLVGGAEVSTFFASDIMDGPQDPSGREMMSLRQGVRTCLFSTFARVDGPLMGLRAPGQTPGPVIQMGSFRTRTLDDEFDVCAWYARHRLPAIAHMEGCIAARVMLSAAGWAKYSVLYEFTSLEARRANFEEKHEALGIAKDHWSHRIHEYTLHTPGSPSVAERIWPLVGDGA
jgi:hypothetical protein